ncbi:hypothetical protein [Candidatus Leptofilum sp.]|uniref:hypothetical protein n=1 Tax=Candidatus Leptofilum sp. TaxID=3241576 RepID=UPI003B5B1F11
MEYTLSLALVDFIPVIFSAVGVFLIARMIARLDAMSGQVAYLAAGLITLGGLSKAVWKLIIATTGNDFAVLDNLLFVFLGPGFTLLAGALWHFRGALAGKVSSQRVWLRPFIIIALFGIGAIIARFVQPQERYWVFTLLALTTLANLAVGILLIRQAMQQRLTLAAGLFLFNLIAVFALSGLARVPEQTIALQWVEETINAFAQGAFAFAAWQLSRETAVGKEFAAEVTENTEVFT